MNHKCWQFPGRETSCTNTSSCKGETHLNIGGTTCITPTPKPPTNCLPEGQAWQEMECINSYLEAKYPSKEEVPKQDAEMLDQTSELPKKEQCNSVMKLLVQAIVNQNKMLEKIDQSLNTLIGCVEELNNNVFEMKEDLKDFKEHMIDQDKKRDNENSITENIPIATNPTTADVTNGEDFVLHQFPHIKFEITDAS
ncbi:uncharacterized protein [Ambystoma mexicanum]|uniref:uncharacterized protein isoform X2 n=1 Tax=Ambystoma mexicanum TaxID=8296 RepID=UPI0037E818BC